MFPQLPSSLDVLAANGVLMGDSEAYIKGTEPRYMMAPQTYLPFDNPLPGVFPQRLGYEITTGYPNLAQPQADSFAASNATKKSAASDKKAKTDKGKTWKKVLLSAVGLSLLILGLSKCKGIQKIFTKKTKP